MMQRAMEPALEQNAGRIEADFGQMLDRIAEMVGYADGVTLRTLLRRKLGRGVRELRADVARAQV